MEVTATAGARVLADDPASLRARISLRDFASIAVQLVLLLLLLRQFQIEGTAFVQLSAVVFAAFAVHAFLPLRWRLPFFGGLGLLSIPMVLGVTNGAWLVGIGFVLIGICHLPLSARLRTALLLLAGALLIAMRAKLLPVPWSEAIWPILGSMFMFRLIAYFYDLRHDKQPVTPAQSVSYFFMAPNACFPLFPVIDFKTFRRSHYAADAHATYQRGVSWMARGVVHLILYRYVYYHLTLAPAEVDTPAELSQYMVSNFLLYLRVSGLFHLVVGMLMLFGFCLPETHKQWLMASSFTDFWRRINIYWKDFMQKIFYFPAVMALKRFGTTNAITLATLYVFVLTWFLHSYQWFWLRGSWLFVPQDILFWTLLGVLVVVNSLIEIKHGRNRRALGKPSWSWRRLATTVGKTYLTFWFICILWSFWTAESVRDWLALWSGLNGALTPQALLFPAVILAVVLAGAAVEMRTSVRPAGGAARQLTLERATTVAWLAALVLISVEGVHTRLGGEVATFVHSLRSGHLSRLDNAKLERGYYEGLMSVNRFNSQLWEVYSKKTDNWLAGQGAGLKRFVDGFAQYELIPSFASSTPYGTVTMNRWGLRDQDYAPQRPADTLRVAVLGASSVMGWGVGDGQTFEALVEERLNTQSPAVPFKRFELLNFGVPGYQPPQQLMAFQRALKLQPNAVFFVATGRESSRSASYLAEAVHKQLPMPIPQLQRILEKAGVTPGMEQAAALKLLLPHAEEILSAVYASIGRDAARSAIKAVWVFLPQVREGSWQEETPAALRAARDAGFEIVDLGDVYRGRDIATIRLAEWDDHPNGLGHRLVAERLYSELAARAATLLAPPAPLSTVEATTK